MCNERKNCSLYQNTCESESCVPLAGSVRKFLPLNYIRRGQKRYTYPLDNDLQQKRFFKLSIIHTLRRLLYISWAQAYLFVQILIKFLLDYGTGNLEHGRNFSAPLYGQHFAYYIAGDFDSITGPLLFPRFMLNVLVEKSKFNSSTDTIWVKKNYHFKSL